MAASSSSGLTDSIPASVELWSEVSTLNGGDSPFAPADDAVYYAVSATWWKAWQAQCNDGGAFIASLIIGNAQLSAETSPLKLKRELVSLLQDRA